MRVKGLHHIQLAMPPGGGDAARTFYGDLLGVPEVARLADLAGRGGCWFEHGTLRIHLGVKKDFTPARTAHPAFVVPDLADLAQRLEAAGFRISRDAPVSGHDRLSVADPFGNRIELMEPLEPEERSSSGVEPTGAIGTDALPANAALRPLAFLVGEWRTTGTHPQVPGETLLGRTSFAWLEGGAFLMMRSTVDHPLFPDGVAVIGSDAASDRFAMTYFDERGVSRLFEVIAGRLTATVRRDDPEFAQEVTFLAGADGDTLTSVGRMSVDGGPWTDDLSQSFVRASARSWTAVSGVQRLNALDRIRQACGCGARRRPPAPLLLIMRSGHRPEAIRRPRRFRAQNETASSITAPIVEISTHLTPSGA